MKFRSFFLALIAKLVLCTSVIAESLPSPTYFAVRSASFNVASLRTIATVGAPTGVQVTTSGYYSFGDGGAATYTLNGSACSLNSGAGDGGYQIPAIDGRCWVAQFSGSPDIRAWGAKADGTTDAGPAIRAACAYSGSAQVTLTIPSTGGSTGFILKTLDPSGLGAIVLNPSGTLTNSQPTPVCAMAGQQTSNFPGLYLNASYLKLGDSLNRPLVYYRKNAAVTLWSNLTLEGNKTNQTGWAGGPNGALYTVQMEDDAAPSFETSMRFNRVVLVSGYNGNMYQGSGRGGTWMNDSWSSYSGQTTADYSLFFNGYDATLNNTQAGSNAGTGMFFAEGSQYQITDGAVFLNGLDGIRINGGKVPYINIKGMNIQSNGCNGINVLSSAPFSGAVAGSHQYTNLTFDGNSNTTTGTCSDFLITDSTIENILSPGFLGNNVSTGNKPAYNVNIQGSSSVWLTSPSLGTGTPYVTAFTNNFARIKGSYNFQAAWTPTLAGSTTAGTPTYVSRVGSWSRNNNEITAHFNVQVSSLGGAAGNINITGLPFFSTASTGDIGNCSITGQVGWTGDTGYTALTAVVGTSSTVINLYELGSGKSGQQTPASNYAAATYVGGVCVYHTDN